MPNRRQQRPVWQTVPATERRKTNWALFWWAIRHLCVCVCSFKMNHSRRYLKIKCTIIFSKSDACLILKFWHRSYSKARLRSSLLFCLRYSIGLALQAWQALKLVIIFKICFAFQSFVLFEFEAIGRQKDCSGRKGQNSADQDGQHDVIIVGSSRCHWWISLCRQKIWARVWARIFAGASEVVKSSTSSSDTMAKFPE